MMADSQTGLGSRLVRARHNAGVWIMQCPQCGEETPDEEWNCASCRINVYWASQHYADLAGIRQQQGLRSSPATPSFLLQAHASAMDERADKGGKVEHKVRQIARRAMKREGPSQASVPAQITGGSHAGVEPGWNEPEIASAAVADGRGPREQQEAT
jgi:hypothetical protein